MNIGKVLPGFDCMLCWVLLALSLCMSAYTYCSFISHSISLTWFAISLCIPWQQKYWFVISLCISWQQNYFHCNCDCHYYKLMKNREWASTCFYGMAGKHLNQMQHSVQIEFVLPTSRRLTSGGNSSSVRATDLSLQTSEAIVNEILWVVISEVINKNCAHGNECIAIISKFIFKRLTYSEVAYMWCGPRYCVLCNNI